MINIIRGIIKSITGNTNRFFKSSGRPDEEIQGKIYQHYGFRSAPPAGVEHLTIQYGNNNVSVAENDGAIIENRRGREKASYLYQRRH